MVGVLERKDFKNKFNESFLDVFWHYKLTGSSSEKTEFLKENLEKNLLLKVSDSKKSVYDKFQEYVLISNPESPSEIYMAYRFPGETIGRVLPIRDLGHVDEIFISGSSKTPKPNKYFRPNNLNDLERYKDSQILLKTKREKESEIYCPGYIYPSERDFYVYLDDGKTRKKVTGNTVDKLLVKESNSF